MWAKAWVVGLAFLACASGAIGAQEAGAAYSAMAPLTRYLSSNEADEIALAKSAAPPSISADADVLTLTSHGYRTAIKGTNGFVCLVERSWAAGFADAEFWNPKLRAPICHNPAAARTVLPGYIERTAWVLAGVSTSEMIARTRAELVANTFVLPEAGAMSYMMSKDGNLGDSVGHWHPHLMFSVPKTNEASWGADLEGSPVFYSGINGDVPEPETIFIVAVLHWSDGTAASHQAGD